MSDFQALGPEEQLKLWEGRALDERPSLATGFDGVDRLLFKGGFQPGNFVILGGRTHTRKTGVALNLISYWLGRGIPVGFVNLDESPEAYVAKLCSTFLNEDAGARDAEWLEAHWAEKESRAARALYALRTKNLLMSKGSRPSLRAIREWWADSENIMEERPRVIVLDYLALMEREAFSGNDTNRIPKLAEDLRILANDLEVVVLALHQVGRQANGNGDMHHGDEPVMLEQLKYGGEEMADVVLGTFRPALSELGNMTESQAERKLRGAKEWEERWLAARDMVKRYQRSTFVQLLKNRPSQKGLCYRGIELVAPASSMYMRELDEQRDLDDFDVEYEQAARRGGTGG